MDKQAFCVKKVRYSLRIDEEIYEQLRLEAFKKRISINTLINNLLHAVMPESVSEEDRKA